MLDYLIDTIPKAVTLASMLAAFLPSPRGRGPLSKLHKAINLLACNFWHAQNK